MGELLKPTHVSWNRWTIKTQLTFPDIGGLSVPSSLSLIQVNVENPAYVSWCDWTNEIQLKFIDEGNVWNPAHVPWCGCIFKTHFTFPDVSELSEPCSRSLVQFRVSWVCIQNNWIFYSDTRHCLFVDKIMDYCKRMEAHCNLVPFGARRNEVTGGLHGEWYADGNKYGSSRISDK